MGPLGAVGSQPWRGWLHRGCSAGGVPGTECLALPWEESGLVAGNRIPRQVLVPRPRGRWSLGRSAASLQRGLPERLLCRAVVLRAAGCCVVCDGPAPGWGRDLVSCLLTSSLQGGSLPQFSRGEGAASRPHPYIPSPPTTEGRQRIRRPRGTGSLGFSIPGPRYRELRC